jgi:hypothetical protein
LRVDVSLGGSGTVVQQSPAAGAPLAAAARVRLTLARVPPAAPSGERADRPSGAASATRVPIVQTGASRAVAPGSASGGAAPALSLPGRTE